MVEPFGPVVIPEDITPSRRNQALAQLLAARYSQKPLNIRFDATGDCAHGYIRVHRVGWQPNIARNDVMEDIVNITFKSLGKSLELRTTANLASPNGQRDSLKSLAGAAALLPTLVLSTDVALAQGPGWTANATVLKLVVTSNGGINVRLSPDVTGCQSQSGYGPNFASIYPEHPGINRMKADLLAAFMSGTPVALYLSDSNCTVGEMILGGW